jgi:hypothetical protein
LTSEIFEFWLVTGQWSEGRRWAESALARTTAAERTVARARLLNNVGTWAVWWGDNTTAHRCFEEGMAIAQEQDLQAYVAFTHTGLGWMAHGQQDYSLPITHHREALAIHRSLGNKIPAASTLVHLAGVLYDQHDYVGAQSLYEESLAIFQELNVEWEIADVLHYLG